MLTFTPSAVKAARDAIASSEEPFLGLRVTAEASGCHGTNYSLGLEDTPEADDTVLEIDGLKIFIDPVSLTLTEGAGVDFVEDERGPVFIFSGPKRGGGCGCSGQGHGKGHGHGEGHGHGHGHGHGEGMGKGGCGCG